MMAMCPLSSRPCTLKMAASPSIHRRAMSSPERTSPPGLLRRSRMKPSAPVPCNARQPDVRAPASTA